MIAASYGLQLFWLLLLAVLGLDTKVLATSFRLDVAQSPVAVCLAQDLVPVGAVLGCAIARALASLGFGRSARQPSSVKVPGAEAFREERQRRILLGVAAALLLLQWGASLPGMAVVGYPIRVLNAAFQVVPFLAGRAASRDRTLHRLWLVSLSLNFPIGLVLGARSAAFFPIVYYAIGYTSSVEQRTVRRGLIAALVLGFVPAVYLSGVIGEVRRTLGRGELTMVTTDRVTAVYDAVVTTMSNSGDSGTDATFGTEGIGRLIIWPNIAVTMLSPDVVPFRPLDELQQQLGDYSNLAIGANMSREDYLDKGLGTAPANDYGFIVNEYTAVDFGLVADGWSHGGAAVACGFGALLTLLCVWLERMFGKFPTPFMRTMMLAVMAHTALSVTLFPLLVLVRMLVLEGCMCAAVIIAVDLVSRRTRLTSPRKARSHARLG